MKSSHNCLRWLVVGKVQPYASRSKPMGGMVFDGDRARKLVEYMAPWPYTLHGQVTKKYEQYVEAQSLAARVREIENRAQEARWNETFNYK